MRGIRCSFPDGKRRRFAKPACAWTWLFSASSPPAGPEETGIIHAADDEVKLLAG